MHDDDYTKQIVTPFGEMPWVQSGIQVGLKSLKAQMIKLAEADSSVKDLNPEACYVLKRRMTGR